MIISDYSMKTSPHSPKRPVPKPRKSLSQTKNVKEMKNQSSAVYQDPSVEVYENDPSSSDTQVPSVSELCK